MRAKCPDGDVRIKPYCNPVKTGDILKIKLSRGWVTDTCLYENIISMPMTNPSVLSEGVILEETGSGQ